MTEIKILYEGVHKDIETDNPKIDCIVDPICSSVVLIKGKKNIIIDPGNFGFEKEILDSLEKQGLKPEDIDYVISTHEHWDHILGIYMFKNAKLVCYSGILQNKRGTYYKKFDSIKIPGIKRIETPGHTPEHMSVVVKTDKTYIIAGDAIRYDMLEKGFANEQEKQSARKILEIADVIIPGHGPVIQGDKLEEFKKLLEA